MRKILVLSLLVLLVFSCERDEKSRFSNGTYTEVSPQAGRTKITFNSSSEVSIVKSNVINNYKYRIEANKIRLSTENGYSETFDFQIISDNEFKIENLYPDVPENPKVLMTFKK